MKYHTLTTVLVGAALIIGCSEQKAPTESQDAFTNPEFNFTNAPDVSGIVTRDEFPFAVTWIDSKAGMRVIIGADMDEFCAGIINFDLVPFQDINLPNDSRLLTLGHGDDLRTTVWGFTDFDCDLFTTVDPLASGGSDLVYPDNDLLVSGDNNANAWGFSAHGKLTRPSGASAVFSGHFKARLNHTGFKSNAKIVLN